MSIIEEAVRKNAERHRQSPPDPLRPQTRLGRVPTAPVDTSHAQRFQPKVARLVQPGLAGEIDCLHDQRVAFPFPLR